MQSCWHSDPECRPSFGDIIRMLEPFVSTTFRANSFFLNDSPSSLEASQQRSSTSRDDDIGGGDDDEDMVVVHSSGGY